MVDVGNEMVDGDDGGRGRQTRWDLKKGRS